MNGITGAAAGQKDPDESVDTLVIGGGQAGLATSYRLTKIVEHPGLYAVGLRWLHSEPSSVFAGVGADAEHVVNHIVANRVR